MWYALPSMRWPGLLLVWSCFLLGTPPAFAQGAAPLPRAPYDCATLERWWRPTDEVVYTSDVPATGPILIPVGWSEMIVPGVGDAMKPTLADALEQVTVTVRDGSGNVVEGVPGMVDSHVWRWHPVDPLSIGYYFVELSGRDPIPFGNCSIHFTPFQVPVTVGDSLVGDWVQAAELAISDSWEVLNIFSNAASTADAIIDCCDVAVEECPDGRACAQCWDATSTPVFDARWTGDGFPWLDMFIEPTVGEVRRKGTGADPTFRQYELLEFGEVCVEGNIGPLGEEPTRAIEVCRTIDTSRLAEVEGRTRVDPGSCLVAPDLEEGTRGLLVVRADTEEEARSLVEASPYSVGAGFVPVPVDVVTETAEPVNPAGAESAGLGESTKAADVAEPGNSTEDAEASSGSEPVPDDPVGTAGASEPGAAQADPSISPANSGCSTQQPAPTSGSGWLWLLGAMLLAARTAPRT